MCCNKPVETPRPSTDLDSSKTHVLGTIFASASRAAAAYNSDELKNYEHAGVRLFINITDKGAAGTVTVKIQAKDPISGTYVDLTGAVTAALAANACTTLTLYPGLTGAANDKVDGHLGLSWRVVATVGGNAVVFSVAAEYLK